MTECSENFLAAEIGSCEFGINCRYGFVKCTSHTSIAPTAQFSLPESWNMPRSLFVSLLLMLSVFCAKSAELPSKSQGSEDLDE
jgi:hypothetical protein